MEVSKTASDVPPISFKRSHVCHLGETVDSAQSEHKSQEMTLLFTHKQKKKHVFLSHLIKETVLLSISDATLLFPLAFIFFLFAGL